MRTKESDEWTAPVRSQSNVLAELPIACLVSLDIGDFFLVSQNRVKCYPHFTARADNKNPCPRSRIRT
jgi:hypothetical protein